jgi:hypothetical protein
MFSKDASHEENFEDFWKNVVLQKFPNARIKTKDQSTWMRLIGLFSKNFYREMTTVIGTTIYFPSKYEYKTIFGLRTLAHEYVHMVDRKNEKKWTFELKYLFPQIMAVFSLLSLLFFVSSWFLLFLVFLLCLVPKIPAPARVRFEANAYTMTLFMMFNGQNWNVLADRIAENIAKSMASRAYYYACGNRQLFAAMLKDRYEGLPKMHEAFKEVKKWLRI